MKYLLNCRSLIKVSIISLIVALMSTVMTQSASSQHNAVCEIKVGIDETEQRVAESLRFKTYNTDPELLNIWYLLFGVVPGASPDDILTLLAPDRTVKWETGILVMGGEMTMKVKTDKNDPTLKNIKIEKAGKNEVPTEFVSGTGGVNPNLADGGWHEVKIKNMDGVTVTIDGGVPITGFLKELKVKLDQDGSVKDFKLKIKGATSVPDVKKSIVSSVVIDVPETVVTAIAGAEYEEKIKAKPEVLSGHTEAEFEREPGAETEGVDISCLLDDNNDQLKERKGPCVVSVDPCGVLECPPTPELEQVAAILGPILNPSFPRIINAVQFVVPTAWFADPDLALDISITLLVDGDQGEQVVALQDASVMAQGPLFTQISVLWTTDTDPVIAVEFYTIRVTVVRLPCGTPEGPEISQTFGPFNP